MPQNVTRRGPFFIASRNQVIDGLPWVVLYLARDESLAGAFEIARARTRLLEAPGAFDALVQACTLGLSAMVRDLAGLEVTEWRQETPRGGQA